MAVLNCVCGQRIEAGNDEALFAALRRHSDAAHADQNIGDQELRDAIAAKQRLPEWDGHKVTLDGPPDIRELTPEGAGDFLRFFDGDAFMDNPFWASCYCMAYQLAVTPQEWDKRSAEENRRDKGELIRSGRARGLLAYASGKVVGWCNASPRAELPGLDQTESFRSDDPMRAGATVCFVVAAPYRGQGVARALLDAACDVFREQGFRYAEAYPPKQPESAARAYHGHLGMYLDAGFAVHRDGEKHVVVRKAL